MVQPSFQGCHTKTTPSMGGWNIVADVSDFIGHEVGIDMVPHTYYPDDCRLRTDQPAVGAGHHANQAPFIVMQVLCIGEEISTRRSVFFAIIWIVRVIVVKHLQESIL